MRGSVGIGMRPLVRRCHSANLQSKEAQCIEGTDSHRSRRRCLFARDRRVKCATRTGNPRKLAGSHNLDRSDCTFPQIRYGGTVDYRSKGSLSRTSEITLRSLWWSLDFDVRERELGTTCPDRNGSSSNRWVSSGLRATRFDWARPRSQPDKERCHQ